MAKEIMDLTDKKIKKTKVLCCLKQCAVFTLSMVIIIGFYMMAMRYVKYKRDLNNLVPDDFSFVFQIDEVKVEEKNFSLGGWAFILGQEALNGDMELWLYDMQEEKIIYPRTTEYTQRIDVNDYFLCEYDYTDCGIIACFESEKLDVANKNYQILISDVDNLKVYRTETYFSKGKVMYCVPEEYVCLDVIGTDLEKIVTYGTLRVYRPDFGMYVYQYEDALYWIAEPHYGFVDEDTYIQFEMGTTQIEKLPEDRLANNWFWSNIGFRFKSKELTEWNTGKYRVAKCELPSDYSITKIWTGNYIEELFWIQYFRPWYELAN